MLIYTCGFFLFTNYRNYPKPLAARKRWEVVGILHARDLKKVPIKSKLHALNDFHDFTCGSFLASFSSKENIARVKQLQNFCIFSVTQQLPQSTRNKYLLTEFQLWLTLKTVKIYRYIQCILF